MEPSTIKSPSLRLLPENEALFCVGPKESGGPAPGQRRTMLTGPCWELGLLRVCVELGDVGAGLPRAGMGVGRTQSTVVWAQCRVFFPHL